MSAHDEIFSMLPWFVNRTLEAQQRDVVKNHIDNCVDCQREISFLESLSDAAQSDAQSAYRSNANVEKDLASVMNRIDRDGTQDKSVSSVISLIQEKTSSLFEYVTNLTLGQWSVSAMAGVLVAVLGVQLFVGQTDGEYSVLSSADINESSMRLSVEVTADIDPEQARSLIGNKLEKHAQQMDVELKQGSEYIVVFQNAVDVSELSEIVNGLESEAAIQRVEILP